MRLCRVTDRCLPCASSHLLQRATEVRHLGGDPHLDLGHCVHPTLACELRHDTAGQRQEAEDLVKSGSMYALHQAKAGARRFQAAPAEEQIDSSELKSSGLGKATGKRLDGSMVVVVMLCQRRWLPPWALAEQRRACRKGESAHLSSSRPLTIV